MPLRAIQAGLQQHSSHELNVGAIPCTHMPRLLVWTVFKLASVGAMPAWSRDLTSPAHDVGA